VQLRCTGGGGERARTVDLLLAKQALSQLSYTPVQKTGIRDRSSKTAPGPAGRTPADPAVLITDY
jgi:hypothetical protein